MNNNPRLNGMISIAMKAGALAVGESRAEEAVRANKAYLIILSEDASQNTNKKFTDMATYRELPIVLVEDRNTFGKLIGRKYAVSAAVVDKGIADSIARLNEISL